MLEKRTNHTQYVNSAVIDVATATNTSCQLLSNFKQLHNVKHFEEGSING